MWVECDGSSGRAKVGLGHAGVERAGAVTVGRENVLLDEGFEVVLGPLYLPFLLVLVDFDEDLLGDIHLDAAVLDEMFEEVAFLSILRSTRVRSVCQIACGTSLCSGIRR